MKNEVNPPAPLSLRRAKMAFRFDKDRDDHGEHDQFVFVPLSLNLDIGVPEMEGFSVLTGYTLAFDSEGNKYVQAEPGSSLIGQVVGMSNNELARLDQVAERTGAYGRSRVTCECGSGQRDVWIFQSMSDAGASEAFFSKASCGILTARGGA